MTSRYYKWRVNNLLKKILQQKTDKKDEVKNILIALEKYEMINDKRKQRQVIAFMKQLIRNISFAMWYFEKFSIPNNNTFQSEIMQECF